MTRPFHHKTKTVSQQNEYNNKLEMYTSPRRLPNEVRGPLAQILATNVVPSYLTHMD